MKLSTMIYLEYLRRKALNPKIGDYISFYHYMKLRAWQLPRE